jgi:predicted nucleotidyltransferase
MGAPAGLVASPNDILAVEYCKAILDQGCAMRPAPIHREGSYHDAQADPENPSATSLRTLIEEGKPFRSFVPTDLFEDAPVHTLAFGERAMLARLRTMTDGEFEQVPYGSEGLWRKLMHECRQKNSLEEILTAVKSKRYTRTRLDRMAMCAFLGLTGEDLAAPAPYARVLAFNDRGRTVLKAAKEQGVFLNAGESGDDSYWPLEQRCGDLYGLFCTDGPEPPGAEENRRIYYQI